MVWESGRSLWVIVYDNYWQKFWNFTCTRLAAGAWMEKITFWQLGPGQNLNRGCDTIIQSNKTFSSRLFNAVEISGLIAFSEKDLSVTEEIQYDWKIRYEPVRTSLQLRSMQQTSSRCCKRLIVWNFQHWKQYLWPHRGLKKISKSSIPQTKMKCLAVTSWQLSITFAFFLIFIWNRI